MSRCLIRACWSKWAVLDFPVRPHVCHRLLNCASVAEIAPWSAASWSSSGGVVAVGIVVLFSAIDVEATAKIVTGPLLLIGLGLGGLASQLGSVTVSAVPDSQSPEVGGLQNTASQFGASLGTALAGSALIAALTASFLTGIDQNPAVPDEVVAQANVRLSSGGEFISDAQLKSALQQAGVDEQTTQAIVDANEQARVDGLRATLALFALFAMLALFFTRRIPTEQPAGPPSDPVHA